MSNFIDRAIGYFNPLQGLRRHHLRELLSRAYEGANTKDGWRPRRAGASANADHAQDGQQLRIRSRALMQNVPYMAQGLRTLVANTIGTGIEPNWLGPNAAVLNAAWARWVKEADAAGRQNYYGLQATAYRTMEQDGEVMLRLRWRRTTDGLTVPLQLQLLEIDWLDSNKTGSGSTSGASVANGIEYDALGRITGYWLFDQHPGDHNTVFRRASLRAASHFVPADQILHLYTLDRPGQARGFPRAAPVIARVRDLQVYEDSELARKNLESRLSVLASGDLSQFTMPPDAGAAPSAASEMGPLSGGNLIQLPPGMTTTVVEPKAAPGYVDNVKWQLHLTAAGFGVPYEGMTGDMAEVNFSSARVRLIDFRREVEMQQWTNIVPGMCDPVCRAFEDAAVLAGLIGKATYEVDHSTPKWDYVNPAQDVRADLDEVSGGLSSISEKLRRRGYKPEAVFTELASDIKRLRELGLLDVLTFGRNAAPASASADTPVSDSKKDKSK